MARWWTAGLLFCLVCTAGVALAQDDAVETPAGEDAAAAGSAAEATATATRQALRHPLTDPPPPLSGVETAFWFPHHPQLQFPAGAPIDVVVGFHNGAAEEVNVSAIMGSLNSPASFDIFVQNFTWKTYDVTLKPGEEASLAYTFATSPLLHPREFQVALTLFYNSRTAAHSTHFFNRTVDVVDVPRWIDTELLGLWLIVFGLLAGAGYLAWGWISSLGFVRKATAKRSGRKAVEPRSEGDATQWLKGTYYESHRAAKEKREVKKVA